MIIHIGLGKTGTTSLQKSVFPELLRMGIVKEYNPHSIMNALRRFIITGEELGYLKGAIEQLPPETLISLESLAGWNPETWGRNFRRNTSIFPRKSTIIITLRDPESYLTSVYVQMVHQGSIVRPESFLVPDSRYDAVKAVARADLCEIFKVDKLNYQKLVELYSGHFKKVVVVPMPALVKLAFLQECAEITASSLDVLRSNFSAAKRENVSYSERAMKWTFTREKILDYFGLKSKSGHDRFFELYSSSFKNAEPQDRGRKKLLSRVLRFIRYRVSWRYLMQNVVDRCLPYNKYALPKQISYGKYYSDNYDFYIKLSQEELGYLCIENSKWRFD